MKQFKQKTLFLTVLLIVLLLVWQLFQWNDNPEDIVLANGTRLEWTPCWFDIPFFSWLKTVHCAYLFPSKDQKLPVVVIKNRLLWNLNSSPILYLSGGPGSPTGLDQESIEFWWTWLEINDWSHDLVLFDQRGTGLSQPQLTCPELLSLGQNLLEQALTQEKEFSFGAAAIKQCYQRLCEEGIELSNYTTTHNSHDVNDLMAALGGYDWNLYGVSYGTRLALSVVKNHPERLRSVILDSVYPPEIDELFETPFIYDNALATLFKGCQINEECHSTFEHLESTFFMLLEQLRETPIELTISELEIDSEKPLKVLINDHRLLEIVFQALYRWDLIEILPLAIDSARRGHYNPLIPLVKFYLEWLLDPYFSDAIYFSVECHDNSSQITREQFMAQVALFPRVRRFVENQWDYNICQIWQVGRENPEFHQPIRSNIPTLLLAGEYDPVTPTRWAKKAAEGFSQGYLFVFPGIGHGVVDSDHCASMITREFLHNPQQKPYNDCLSNLTGSQFIIEDKFK